MGYECVIDLVEVQPLATNRHITDGREAESNMLATASSTSVAHTTADTTVDTINGDGAEIMLATDTKAKVEADSSEHGGYSTTDVMVIVVAAAGAVFVVASL